MKRSLPAALLGTATLLVARPANAQNAWHSAASAARPTTTLPDFSSLLPATPRPMAPPPLSDETLPEASNAGQTILPALRGIVLAAHSAHASTEGNLAISMRDLTITTADRTEITALIRPYLNKPVTFRTLGQIQQTVTTWFRAHGRAFLTVITPPQRITDGILHLTIMEYRIGKITVSGNQWFSSAVVRARAGMNPGDLITLQGLQADLTWMNGNPFRTVDTIFHPGSTPGTTDLDLQVADRIPLYVYGAYSNQADPSLGRLNWSVGASWGNAFGIDHTLSYQFTRSDTGRFNTHTGSWEIPLPWRDKLLIYGTYSRVFPFAKAPYRSTAISGQASFRYVHMIDHIALGHSFGIDGMIVTGFDWKTTNSDQFYKSTPIMASNADTDQFMIAYDGSVQDPLGQTKILNQIFYGPGGLTQYDNRKAYKTIFQNAKPDYVYDRLNISRAQPLPGGFESDSIAALQATTHNLLYSEQLEAGGMGSVRGYYVNTALGSRGILFSQEFRTPAFSAAKTLHLGTQFADSEKLGVFWDWSQTSHPHAITFGPSKNILASTGLNLISTINRITNITVDLGWRLRGAPVSNTKGAFCDFNVIVGL